MAGKTITIDTEAYRRLKSARRPNESFSEIIKRRIPPPFDFDAWIAKMRQTEFSPEMVRAVEE